MDCAQSGVNQRPELGFAPERRRVAAMAVVDAKKRAALAHVNVVAVVHAGPEVGVLNCRRCIREIQMRMVDRRVVWRRRVGRDCRKL